MMMDVDYTQSVPTTPRRKGLQRRTNIPPRLSFASLPRDTALRVAGSFGAPLSDSASATVIMVSPVRSRTKSTPSPRHQRTRAFSQFSRKNSNAGNLHLNFRSLKKHRSTSSLANSSGTKSIAKRVRSSTALVVSATALWTSASRLTRTAKRLITRSVSSSVASSFEILGEPRTYTDVAMQVEPELNVMDVEAPLIGAIDTGAVGGRREGVEELDNQDIDLEPQDMDTCDSPVSPLTPSFLHPRRNPVEVTQHHRFKSMQKLGVESYKDVMEKYPVSAEEEALAFKCY
ncbi:hypothetical protein K443DRAFT_682210 [Laccaria amethystina LaAM-08-1]|uniref:Uncharacterized protein n=1 Tax=Laccaria amethystina LaAM-08-1 TaxID=1095629 RepID=A0A0C9WVQ3_9AGAR|nr:hypothetical protein K443DRAFT_682210 [Laccaria amethystina LaAM-08-1]